MGKDENMIENSLLSNQTEYKFKASRTISNIWYCFLMGTGGLILGYNLTVFDNLGNAVCDALDFKNDSDRKFLKSWVNTFYPMGKMIGSFVGS